METASLTNNYRFSIVIPLLILLASVAGIATTAAQDQPSLSPTALSCQAAISATYKALDQTAGTSAAVNSVLYTRGVEGTGNGTYVSTFQIDETVAPYPTCTEKVLSYNFVFELINKTGGWLGYLVISESQNLTVLGSRLQTQAIVERNHNPAWGGYEVKANSGATQAVYASLSLWTQPGVQYPNSGGCGSAGTCNLSVWVGLTDSSMASNKHLDQDGTAATCTVSGTTCGSTLYYAWYEVLQQGNSIACIGSNWVNVRPGDLMDAETLNEAQYGGSNTKYDFTVSDLTSHTSCYVGGVSDTTMPKPVFGEAMVENSQSCNGSTCQPLAAFGTVPFQQDQIYTAGSWSYINNFLTGAYDMANQQGTGVWGICYPGLTTNVSYGSLGTYGAFTMTYQSNQYTPYWSSGC